MTTKIYCEEQKKRHLVVDYIDQNFITILIDDNDPNDDEEMYDDEKLLYMNLTVKKAELLMDEIHRAIIKLEGGSNE